MIPLILGLGGLAAKVAAAAVIPRIFRAISRCIPTTTPTRPPEPVSVERISSGSETPQTTAKWGVSLPQPRSRKWGYAGLFHHGPSGLDLATYRTYDSKAGRWISRDPLGEGVDYNLYRYCGNNPINCVDPEGLAPFGGRVVVLSAGQTGGLGQAYTINIDGDYNPETGRADVYLDTKNHLPTAVRVKITLSLQQLSAGEPGKFTTTKKKKPWEKNRCPKTSDSMSRNFEDAKHEGKNNERYTAKIDPASFVRIRLDVVITPYPLINGNPFSPNGVGIYNFTQGSGTYTLDGFHSGDRVVDINDL